MTTHTKSTPRPSHYPDYWEPCQNCGSWDTDAVSIDYIYLHYKPNPEKGKEPILAFKDSGGGPDHSHFECNMCGEMND